MQQETPGENTHETLAKEMDDNGSTGWAYRTRELGSKFENMRVALERIYLEDIFDDSMRKIAKEALGV